MSARKLTRRQFLGGVAATGGVLALSGALGTQTVRAGSGRPNVVLLISDDQGIDQSGCYGNNVIRTPNLDALAAEGVRFTQAFTTAASCSPSRSSILTGLYPHQNGQYGLAHRAHHFRLFEWVETLPTLLHRSGYRTGVVGKLHVEPRSQSVFDFTAPGRELMGNRNVAKMAEYAGRFISSCGDQPFFLLVGFSDPHRTRNGFANDRDYPGVRPVGYDPGELPVPRFLPDWPEVREELAEMYEAVTRMDIGVGMILEKLTELGKADNTLVIYVSDNGIPFPGAKTNIYDAGVRLPMIVRAPGVGKSGTTCNALVSFVDIVPTILEWTGVPGPEYTLPGRSLLPLLRGEKQPERDVVFLSHSFHEVTMYYPMRGVRTQRYKYIQNLAWELEFPFASDLFRSKTWQAVLERRSQRFGVRTTEAYLRRPAEELYDLEQDPDEVHNLANDTAHGTVLQDLRERLEAMRKRTSDPWLILNNYVANRLLYKS